MQWFGREAIEALDGGFKVVGRQQTESCLCVRPRRDAEIAKGLTLDEARHETLPTPYTVEPLDGDEQ